MIDLTRASLDVVLEARRIIEPVQRFERSSTVLSHQSHHYHRDGDDGG
jgi:hypothetical protein